MRFKERDVVVTTYNTAIPKPVFTIDLMHTPSGRVVTGAGRSSLLLKRRLMAELRELVKKE